MKRSSSYFKMYSKYGLEGYYIPVRNTFNNCIEREFIPVGARELYETKFGEEAKYKSKSLVAPSFQTP